MFSLRFFARCLLALLFLNISNAFPIAIRQATNSTLSGPTTVMTVSNSMTPAGELTQTCIITLTPITDNGKAAVQEVKNCTVAMNANSNSTTSTSSTSSNSNSTASSSSNTSNSSVSDTGSSSTPSSTPSSTDSAASVSSTSIAVDSPISVNGAVTTMTALTPSTQSASVGAVSASTTPTPSASTDSSGSTPSASLAGSSGSNPSASLAGSSGSTPSASLAGSSTPTAAAANSDPSASGLASQQLAEQTYVVPGKSLQVLPIGLGVFAGISALALIVVGLVTYERTKYRKAFRQRKLAEQGAAMGYSR